jgi:hypothetical protein
MSARRLHETLYLVNATVLLTHQMDAAYWREWDLFGMPGGVQLYLVLNLPIVALILYGARALAVGRGAGVIISWLVVASGFIAVGLHAYLLLRGHEEFRLPVSLGLLAATSVLSVAQAVVLIRARAQLAGTAASG